MAYFCINLSILSAKGNIHQDFCPIPLQYFLTPILKWIENLSFVVIFIAAFDKI
jgi:hypothetical protein